jgi:hypothetical protein
MAAGRQYQTWVKVMTVNKLNQGKQPGSRKGRMAGYWVTVRRDGSMHGRSVSAVRPQHSEPGQVVTVTVILQ